MSQRAEPALREQQQVTDCYKDIWREATEPCGSRRTYPSNRLSLTFRRETPPNGGIAVDAYFLDLMKATSAFAFGMDTEPGGIVALMTPFGKPFTICLSGSRIDSSR